MLDIKFIRDNVDLIRQTCKNKHVTLEVDELLKLDGERRDLLKKTEDLRATKNQKSKGKPSPEDIEKMKRVGEEIKTLEGQLATVEEKYTELLYKVPNLVHEDVPVGKDETANKVIKQFGKKPEFDFQPKEHWELGEAQDLIDLKRASEVSGARFAYIKGDLALMEFALIQYTLSVVTNEKTLKKIAKQHKLDVNTKPFVPVVPPVLMHEEVMRKMGRLEPREERYHIPSDNLYLVGSAEHTLGPLHMNETIEAERLPIRYMGFSTAFRREAGSYGKDTKGILRVHQFDKLEFESFTTPEDGLKEQNFIMAIQQYLMEALDLPFQIVQKCTGDMGAPDYREFDIEAWLPGQNRYRETHTSDYMTDYQARRLNTRLQRMQAGNPTSEIRHPKSEYVHMNDATVFAIGRTLIAIMENYQQKDGHIKVPKVLQTYMGKKLI